MLRHWCGQQNSACTRGNTCCAVRVYRRVVDDPPDHGSAGKPGDSPPALLPLSHTHSPISTPYHGGIQ